MDDGDDGRSGWLLAAPPTLHAGLKLTRPACPCLHHTGLSLYEHQQSMWPRTCIALWQGELKAKAVVASACFPFAWPCHSLSLLI
jgi:hypothetical protein